MRQLLFLIGLMALMLTARAEDFTRTMTAEEKAATGLDQLSPQQLERLKAVVERYKTGEVAVVKKEAEQKVAVAEQKAVVAEAKAKEVESKAESSNELSGNKPGWFTALITLQKTGEKPEKAGVLEGRLVGDLRTFNGKRKFELQDGQVWEMIEAGSYSGPVIQSPPVTIRPGFMGIYWLEITEGAVRVKVKLLKLK